jgi:multidrug efflux system membrane fusion protein
VVTPESTAEVRDVTLDAIQGDVAIVSKGLAVGEQVVVDGQAQLRKGSKVQAKPAPTRGPGPSPSAQAARNSEATP